MDSLEPIADEPELASDISCDLLIVGGGFCGLWASILAKQTDPERDVVLIEAKSIANGASGRPAAIMSTSVMHGIDNTERMFPDEVEALEKFGRENMDGFKATVEEHNIDCDIEWGGEMVVSIGDEGLDVVDKGYELYIKYGHDAQKLDKQQIQSEIKSPIFHGAVWSKKRCGTVHPGKLVRGLKTLAKKFGVQIYENTAHIDNSHNGNLIQVRTARAGITASKVLLATNAWGAGHKKIKTRVAAIRDRILMTEPLTQGQMEKVGWANRQGIYDTRTQLNYMRLTADNRILFGG